MNDKIIEIKDDSGVILNIGQLHEYLAKIPDKRKARGKRYSLAVLLLVIIFAKLSGENTLTGISDWAKLRKKELQIFFNCPREIKPGHNTIRRTMADLSLVTAVPTLNAGKGKVRVRPFLSIRVAL